MTKKIENEVPLNDKVRKPTPKKTFNLEDYKKNVGADDVPDKPLEWIKIDDALEEVTGMPGFPKGYVSSCLGFSNSGKSTGIELGIVNGQKMGLLPIIIDTENNMGKYRLSLMGFDWGGNYISIDNEFLLEKFGRPKDKNRTRASIEDLASCVRFFLREQESGKLPFELLFAIDSIGVMDCNQVIEATDNDEKTNNLWNAGSYEREFKSLFNEIIPNSRKINKLYTNTVILVQKIGYDAMNNAITMKGGKMWEYVPRLQFFFGNVLTKGVKKITAVSKKRDVSYGISCRVQVLKNQIDSPLGGISMEGPIISTPHGYVVPDKLDEYKKKNILYFRNLFGENLNVDDIEDGERIETEEGKLISSGKLNINNDETEIK
jgi:hypothetical protein